MVTTTENKNNYFVLDIQIEDPYLGEDHIESELNDGIDHVLYAMSVKADEKENYKALSFDKSRQIHIFRTDNRKRRGQLNKFCSRYLPNTEFLNYTTKAIRADELPRYINKIEKNENFKLENLNENIALEKIYTGSDIEVFKDKKNWHKWQQDIYKKIYNKDGTLKKPDLREIISIVDFVGNTGKSSFFKYIYVNDRENIGRITYGTSNQLRSSIVNIGEKKLYIVDLARTKGSCDKQEDLLAAIEDIKTGAIFTAMYGKGKELIMEPPHIIISSNYVLNPGSLSKDRWCIYKIEKDKTLGKKNELLRKIKSEKYKKK